jgi:uncharacterized protein
MRRWLLALACMALWLAAAPLPAQGVLPVPPLSARVIDQTGTLGEAQRSALEDKLAAFEAAAGTQIVVLMVPTTQPEDIASYAQRLGDTWKIGRKDVGDGLLLVVAKNDRRVFIATAKALEGAVPDLAARQIIDRAILPAFRADDYAGGIDAGVDQLIARVKGEQLPAPSARSEARKGLQWEELAMFFFIGVPIIGSVLKGVLGRKLGSVATAGAAGAFGWWFSASLILAGVAGIVALLLVGVMGVGAGHRMGRRGGPPIIWGGGGGGGWGGGGGFGGGGFSSGGGGDFGGGGAGGSW